MLADVRTSLFWHFVLQVLDTEKHQVLLEREEQAELTPEVLAMVAITFLLMMAAQVLGKL